MNLSTISAEPNHPTGISSPTDWISTIIIFSGILAQIVLTFFTYIAAPFDWIQNIGWGILTSTAIFGQLPIYTFKKYGKVRTGKNYMYTQQVVDRGIYSIMRHPQFFANFLITYGLATLSQTWWSLGIALFVTPLIYYDILRAEHRLVEKFGDSYRSYMQRVPRINFIRGIWRKLFKTSINREHI